MNREYTIREIAEARRDGDLARLNETSLGRAYQHLLRSSAERWGLVGAGLGRSRYAAVSGVEATEERVRDYNRRAGRRLRAFLEATCRYGFTPLYANWKEPDGSLGRDSAFFVPRCDLALTRRLVRVFLQDVAVYAGPETSGDVVAVRADGSTDRLGTFDPGRIARAFAAGKGEPFAFEWAPGSMGEALTLYHVGTLGKEVYASVEDIRARTEAPAKPVSPSPTTPDRRRLP